MKTQRINDTSRSTSSTQTTKPRTHANNDPKTPHACSPSQPPNPDTVIALFKTHFDLQHINTSIHAFTHLVARLTKLKPFISQLNTLVPALLSDGLLTETGFKDTYREQLSTVLPLLMGELTHNDGRLRDIIEVLSVLGHLCHPTDHAQPTRAKIRHDLSMLSAR